MGAQATPPRCCDLPPRGHTLATVPSMAPVGVGEGGSLTSPASWVYRNPRGCWSLSTGTDQSLAGGGVTDLTEGQMRAARTCLHTHTSARAHLNSVACTSTRACLCVHACGSLPEAPGAPPRLGPNCDVCPLNTCPGKLTAPAWLQGRAVLEPGPRDGTLATI